jgi:hypothetical protein
MKILFIGDIVGNPGRHAVRELLPGLLESMDIELVIANCENAAGGFGVTRDIVEELFREQDYFGGWGKLQSKDYTAKDKFPTSQTAINRCLYIGLTIEDRDILLRAYEYFEDFLKGTSHEKLHNKNERDFSWETASICETIEAIKPYNELCD